MNLLHMVLLMSCFIHSQTIHEFSIVCSDWTSLLLHYHFKTHHTVPHSSTIPFGVRWDEWRWEWRTHGYGLSPHQMSDDFWCWQCYPHVTPPRLQGQLLLGLRKFSKWLCSRYDLYVFIYRNLFLTIWHIKKLWFLLIYHRYHRITMYSLSLI